MDQIIEIREDCGLMDVLVLTRHGSWEPLATIQIDTREVIERYRTPLLVKFGYTHSDQSDRPQEPGRR
jgi:hypothetical protein